MSLKKLFQNKSTSVSNKEKSSTSFEEVGSIENVEEISKERIRVIPEVDYEDPSNFAYYGMAEKYYVDAIQHIYKTYPYDGSFYEKKKWENNNSDLTNYFFQEVYPKQTGYINIGYSYGNSSSVDSGYSDTDTEEYIEINGLLNVDDSGNNKKDLLNSSNKFRNEIYNLKMTGEVGATVEFYFKRDNLSGSQKQVIFDLWNGENTGSNSYGRFKIETHPGIIGEEDKFYVEVSSGSSGVVDSEIGNNLNFVSSWHHYAVAFVNSGSQVKLQLFVDGDMNSETLSGTNIGDVKGSITATLGALNTAASGTLTSRGWGKLSGSIDEFRYWKEKRSDKDISTNYFLHVNGGVDSHNTGSSLGVYYKFNEGIYSTSSVSNFDSNVLDYSGRIANGVWTGHTLGSRNTGSALELSNNTKKEPKEPILYSSQEDVLSLIEGYGEKGREYDIRNNANLYGTLPSWIYDEDQENGEGTKELFQILSYFFDDAHNKIKFLPQIKHTDYKENPLPFTIKMLEDRGFQAIDLFSNSTTLETFLNRSETEVYKEGIQEIKNIIYQNIYNNLLYFYKSKGTEKSFRNLIHCFGIDESLIKMNMYSDTAEFVLQERSKASVLKKNTIDFNKPDNFGATIVQRADGGIGSLGYLPSTEDYRYLGTTTEARVVFPKKFISSEEYYFQTDFVSSSIFGMHESAAGTWASPDRGSFQVFTVRPELESSDAYFQLSSSYLGINLTSSLFRDVYDDKKWNIAFRIRHEKYPIVGNMLDTTTGSYFVELYGTNYEQDIKQESFLISASVDSSLVENFYSANKMLYAGAHRENFSGSLVSNGLYHEHKTDIRLIDIKHWNSYLNEQDIDLHARDMSKKGTDGLDYRTAVQQYLIKNASSHGNNYIPQTETLSLHWSFDNITGSNSGEFTVLDASSGSLDRLGENMISEFTKYNFTARGLFFEDIDQTPNRIEYLNHSKTRLPEVLNNDDLVEILEQDDELYTRETKPVNYFFAIEKSMYQTISEEMLSWIGSVALFNNLIGKPIYRYEENYREMDLLRELFFKNVENEPDFDKFLEFYKWVDNSISLIVEQFVPISMNYSSGVSNIVESHILERNKYRHKLPTIEFAGEPPLGVTKAVGHLLYNWKVGHAPLSGLEKDHCYWWKFRAEREGNLNEERVGIFSAVTQALNRDFTKVYNINSNLSGNVIRKKRETSIIIRETAFDLAGTAFLEVPDILPPNSDCDD